MAAEWRIGDFEAMPSILVAAHELKAPLSLIRQMSLLIEEGRLDVADATAMQRQITQTTEKAFRLVSDLSLTANLNQQLFPLEPVNPLAVISQITLQSQPMLAMYDRRVRWPNSGRKHKQLIIANPVLLSRVLMNFLDNALKYSDTDAEICVILKNMKGKVRLAVRDFGPMMSLKDYRRLVSELEVQKSVRTRPDSSGLGVYIASRFAKMMNGQIGLVRHRDGLTFYIDLPISDQMSML